MTTSNADQFLIRSKRIPGYYRGYRVSDKTGSLDGRVYIAPYELRIGAVNPKWEAQIASKSDASTDYYLRKDPSPSKGKDGLVVGNYPVAYTWYTYEWLVDHWGIWVTRVDGYPHWDGLSPMFTSNTSYTSEIASLMSTAKLAFLGKLKEAQQSFSAPTFLGELRETVKMLRNPIAGFTKSTLRYRAKVRRLTTVRTRLLARGGRLKVLTRVERQLLAERLNRLQSSLEKAYLQWTFGVAPLVGDVKAMIDTVDKLKDSGRKVVRLSITIPRQLEAKSFIVKDVVANNRVVLVKNIRELATAIVRFRGAVAVDTYPPDSFDRLRELSGLNLEELVPTLYELTPFSWAADYVSTLGDAVNGAFVSKRNLIYATQSYHLKATRRNICVPLHGPWGVGRVVPGFPSEGSTDFVSHKRTKANLVVSLSDLRFTIPQVKQIVNLLAVASQLIRSKMGDH